LKWEEIKLGAEVDFLGSQWTIIDVEETGGREFPRRMLRIARETPAGVEIVRVPARFFVEQP